MAGPVELVDVDNEGLVLEVEDTVIKEQPF